MLLNRALRQAVTCNVTLKRVRVTTFVVGKQDVLNIINRYGHSYVSHPACKSHLFCAAVKLSSVACPALPYYFSTLSHKRQGFRGGGVTEYKMCVLISSTAFVRNTSQCKNKSAKYYPKYTGCNRRNGPDFGRVFLMLNYTEKPRNTCIQS